MQADRVYKVCSQAEWNAALVAGAYHGSDVDRRDGFIHLSTDVQLAETLRRHFAGRQGLVLVAFDAATLTGLRWEPSRGGDLFPHVYGELPVRLAREVRVVEAPPR